MIFSYLGNLLLAFLIALVAVAAWAFMARACGRAVLSNRNLLRTACCTLIMTVLFCCTVWHSFLAMTFGDFQDTVSGYADEIAAIVREVTSEAETMTQGDMRETVDAVAEQMPVAGDCIQEISDEVLAHAATVQELPSAIVQAASVYLSDKAWHHIWWGLGLFVVLGVLIVVLAQEKRQQGYAGSRTASSQYCDNDFSF